MALRKDLAAVRLTKAWTNALNTRLMPIVSQRSEGPPEIVTRMKRVPLAVLIAVLESCRPKHRFFHATSVFAFCPARAALAGQTANYQARDFSG